ncbi:MAG: RNA 2',3'-cyclic phosphodiesterase [Planctomycetota bacterium]|nr:RNA 2',3'-cyclic phosphodiesterase [Planctomycetota bacterium]
MSNRARAFVALRLGPALGRRALEVVAADLADRSLRPVRAEGLHLTLAFLGEVERERAGAIARALAKKLAGAASPELELDGTGAFPRPGRERVLWMGVVERPGTEGRLEDLHRRVLRALESAGWDTQGEAKDPGKPLRAHVTLARVRAGRGGVAPVPESFYAARLGLPWSPDEVALVESVRRGSGPPHYEPLERFPLERD